MAFNKNFLNTIGLFLKNVNSLFVYLLNTWSQRGEGTCCRTSTLICVISEVIKRWRWCIIICSLFVVLDEALYVGWHLGRVECRAPHWRIWKTNKQTNKMTNESIEAQPNNCSRLKCVGRVKCCTPHWPVFN